MGAGVGCGTKRTLIVRINAPVAASPRARKRPFSRTKMRWPLLLLVAAVAIIAWTSAGSNSDRFVQFVRVEDGVHIWVNPGSVAQIRESLVHKNQTMIVFSTGVWIDVAERPTQVVHRLSE